MMLADFLDYAHASAGLEGLLPLAEAYVPPRTAVQREVSDIPPEELDDAVKRVSPRTISVLMDGPAESNRGRSETLFWLGHLLVRDQRHTFDEIVALLTYADARWGKFHGRPDAERRIVEIAEKAWDE